MDVTEAYRQTEEPLYSAHLRSATQIELEAKKEGLPFAWLCLAGLYARRGDRQRFIEAITKAEQLSDNKAVHTLSQNADAAYELIQKDSSLVQHAKRKFAEQIQDKFPYKLSIEEILSKLDGTKTKHTRKSVILSKSNLIFEAYRFENPEDELNYDKKIAILNDVCGTAAHHPIVISAGKEINMGWYLGIF